MSPSFCFLRAGVLVAAASLPTPVPLSAGPSNWPQFRGPDGVGTVRNATAPYEWGENQNLLWKTPLPGQGWSSPVVRGDQIWLTTGVTHGEPAAGENGTQSVESVSLSVLCVSRKTGVVVREIKLFEVEDPEPIHAQNSYASPTPCISDGRVYCDFGRNGTAAIDATTGEVLWRKEFVIDHYVGAGSSPVMCEGLLILTRDGADQQYILALDPADGEVAWRTKRPAKRAKNPDFLKSFSTPLLVEHEGQKQLVIPGSQWIVAYAPKDGRELWRMDHGNGFSLVTRPVADREKVYFCTGFLSNEVQAVRLGGSGDLDESHLAWSHDRGAPNRPSPVLHQNRLILVNDTGVVQCLSATDGQLLWRKRLRGNFSASVMLVNDRYYFFSREGVATMLDQAGEELGENRLDGAFQATPAIVDGQWIVRTDTHLYAFGQ